MWIRKDRAISRVQLCEINMTNSCYCALLDRGMVGFCCCNEELDFPFSDLCFELLWKNCECVICPGVTQCSGWGDEILELTHMMWPGSLGIIKKLLTQDSYKNVGCGGGGCSADQGNEWLHQGQMRWVIKSKDKRRKKCLRWCVCTHA